MHAIGANLAVAPDEASGHIAVERAHANLAAAVHQVADAVVITDASATITYVNPAFERVSGYRRDELIGANPRILRSGHQNGAVYEAMWSSLLAGMSWHGELVNRRKDGVLYTEEATITPIHDNDGRVTNYVGVKRDVTSVRALQADLDGAIGEHAALSASLTDFVPGETAEATARAICDRLLALPGVRFAAVALFVADGRIRSLSAMGPDRRERQRVTPESHRTAPFRRRAMELRAQAERGWSLELWNGRGTSAMAPTYAALGISALAVTPMVWDGHVVGFVQAGATGNDGPALLTEARAMIMAMGKLASMFIGSQAVVVDAQGRRDDVIRRIIERREFHSVFQAIVRLDTGAVVGYEALTRFTDRTPPDQRFLEAADAGLGIDLELVTLEAAMAEAALLPRDAYLDVNVSPALLARPANLAATMWRSNRPNIVLEITEHEVIRDYAGLRRQVAELGLPVRIAVDDAGAGFASLRHILELRPHMIKLDRSLVAGIDADPIRQALVAGMRHFATAAGAQLLAEGIETEDEFAALWSLGVELGQGYLLGRPDTVARLDPDSMGGPRSKRRIAKAVARAGLLAHVVPA